MNLRPTYTFLTAFLLCIFAAGLHAGEVPLKEVSLSLYNKQVTGYRLVLDRSQTTVSQHIVQHVAFYDSHKPFQYEQTIIYENLVYPPVTDAREITLYYLLRNLQDHYTELTVVAMYDYKRSVCMREFPDLAQRLVADIALLVRQTSGDVVKFGDVAYDDGVIAKVAQNIPPVQGKQNASGDGAVIKAPAGETKNEQVLVQADPFRKEETFSLVSEDSLQRQILAQRKMLEEKEEELILREKVLQEDKQRYQTNLAAVAEAKVLRDSIQVLHRRIQNLMRAEYSGDASTSSDGNEKLLRTQEQLSQASAEKGMLATRLDSMMTAARLTQKDLATAQQQRDEYKDKYQAEKLKNEMIGSGAGSGNLALQSENDELKRALTDVRNQKSQLERQLDAAGDQPALRDSIRLLQGRITAMERVAGDNTAQMETISRQQSQLQAKDQQLKALEQKQAANRAELESNANRISQLETQLQTAREEAKALAGKGSATAGQIETYQQQLRELNKSLEQVDQKMSSLQQQIKADQDSIQKLRSTIGTQQKNLNERDRILRQSRSTMDSLTTALVRSEENNRNLRTQSQTLQQRVDSLAVYAATPNEQSAFVRDQWKKLQDWEARLNERARQAEDKEKLDAQREAYLKKREQELSLQEQRYQNLQERETRIRLREQQLGIPNDGSIPPPSGGALPIGSTAPSGFSGNVRAERHSSGAGDIPVISYTSTKTYGELQKQIVGYMVSIGKYHDTLIPEITYFSTTLSDITSESLEVRFRLQANGSGTIVKASFKLPNGTYVEPNISPELHSRAMAFMEKMANWR